MEIFGFQTTATSISTDTLKVSGVPWRNHPQMVMVIAV